MQRKCSSWYCECCDGGCDRQTRGKGERKNGRRSCVCALGRTGDDDGATGRVGWDGGRTYHGVCEVARVEAVESPRRRRILSPLVERQEEALDTLVRSEEGVERESVVTIITRTIARERERILGLVRGTVITARRVGQARDSSQNASRQRRLRERRTQRSAHEKRARVRYRPVLDVPAWRKVATCTPPRQRVRRRSDGAHLSIIILPIRRSRARMRVPTSQLSPLLLRSVQLYSQVGPAPARRVRGGLSEGLSRFRTRKHLAKHARDDRAGRLASCFLI